MAQLEFLRNVDYPSRLETYKRRIALLLDFGNESEENARIAKEELFGYQNSFKAITGYLEPLRNSEVMAAKQADEAKQEAAFKANSKNKDTANPWTEIADSIGEEKKFYLPLSFIEKNRGFNTELAYYALDRRVVEEKTKPNEKRLREYRDSALPRFEQGCFPPRQIYKSLDTVTLADSLAQMQEALGTDNPVVKQVLNGQSPTEAAKNLIEGTKLDDVALRKQLYEGGPAAVQASTDPLIALMRNIDPAARELRKQYDDQVDAVENEPGQDRNIDLPTADTTSRPMLLSPSLSFGVVKGYEENGKKTPYFTELGGAYQHASENGDKPPYQLPESWMKAKSKLKLDTPLDYVSTADIIGGNSGSPTVNTKGEVVGIIFDGNIQSLEWNFVYEDKQARAVHVDSRGIVEALRQIYGATALVDELTGSKAAK
jgi:hypothetical protein